MFAAKMRVFISTITAVQMIFVPRYVNVLQFVKLLFTNLYGRKVWGAYFFTIPMNLRINIWVFLG